MTRSRKKRTLIAAEKRAVASAGLIVTRYDAGERATVQQLAPESDGAGVALPSDSAVTLMTRKIVKGAEVA